MKKNKSFFSFFFDVFFLILLGMLTLYGILTLSSNTQIFGNYSSFLVQSGSMEPTIMTGDIIIIKNQPVYTKNDVITFHTGGDKIVTHRIVEIIQKDGITSFNTKGDANRSEDSDTITQTNIMGKVVFDIPKLGYFMTFSKSTFGFFLLIILPTSLLIIDQLFKMFHVRS